MRVGLRPAPLVDLLQHVLDLLVHAVEVGVLVEHAVLAAFAAGAVVAGDVEDQGVVGLAHFLEGLQHAADLEVGVLGVGGEHLGLAREQALLVGRERVPVLDRRRLGRQLRARGHHAQRDLPRQRLLADLVPARVELALPLVDPVLRRMVRRVGGAGGEVDERRLVRRQRLLVLDPGARLLGHVGHEVVVRVVRQFDHGGAVVQVGRPLVGLAAEEAVELVEALPGRPAVEGPGHAGFPGRGLVPLAERGGGVAVQAQHLGQRCGGAGDLAGGAREAGRHLGDEPHVHRVMVAAGLQRGARRRAQRGGVEVVVAQATLGQLVQRGHGTGPPKLLGTPKPRSSISTMTTFGAPGRRLDLEARRQLDVARVDLGVDRALGLGDRQHSAVERGRCLTDGSHREGRSQQHCREATGQPQCVQIVVHGFASCIWL